MSEGESTISVVVGRIGKPHGIRGELSVEVRTDEPEARFAPGAVLATDASDRRPPATPARTPMPQRLTVESIRWHQSRLLVRFVEVADRNAAEDARGLLLEATIDPRSTPQDPDEFYDHQLVGLAVETEHGTPVGTVHEIVHGPAQDLLAVRAPDGREILVPFVGTLVPTVDLAAGRVVVVDKPGLLVELDEDA